MGNTNDKPESPSKSLKKISNEDGFLAQSSIKRVVWHDPNVNNDENLHYFQREFAKVELERFTAYEGAAEFLRKALGTWIVITSGKSGSKFIPLIHDLANVSGIIIFCKNKEYHEEWSRKFCKVRKVVTHIREVQKELTSVFDREIINGALKFGEYEAIGGIQDAFNHVLYGAQKEEIGPEECVFLHSDSNKNMQFAAIAKIFSKECYIQPESILCELVKLNPEAEDIITQEFELRKQDLLETIIYLYSTNHLYKQFNRTFAAQRYQDLAYTLSVCIKELEERPNLAIRDGTVLYRGMPNSKHAARYMTNDVLFWPAFTSTSKNDSIAKTFAGSDGIIFAIRLAKRNPHPNIIVNPGWSKYSKENEVLLFPHFAFRVIGQEKRENRLWISVEQDSQDNFFCMKQEKFDAYWKETIEKEIISKFDEFLQHLYEPIRTFDYIDSLLQLENFSQHINSLISLLRSNNKGLYHLNKIIKDWFHDMNNYSSDKLLKTFDEYGKRHFGGDKSSQFVLFKELYCSCCQYIQSYFRVFSPFFTKFVFRLLPMLDISSESLETKDIIQRTLDEMEPCWALARRSIDLELRIRIEEIKPEIRKRLESYYSEVYKVSDTETDKTVSLKEKLRRTQIELGPYEVMKHSPDIQTIIKRLEGNFPTWLGNFQSPLESFISIEWEKPSKVELIVQPDRDSLSQKAQNELLITFIENLDTIFKDHRHALTQVVFNFSKLKSLVESDLFQLSKGLSRFSHKLQHLELNFAGCELISQIGFSEVAHSIIKFRETLGQLIIDFSECACIGDESVSSLANTVMNTPKLQKLTLIFNECKNITDVGLTQLGLSIGQAKKTLHYLEVRFDFCTNFTDTGLIRLANGISQCSCGLQQIILSFKHCTNISVMGFNELSASITKHSSTLEDLELSFVKWKIFNKGPIQPLIKTELEGKLEEFLQPIYQIFCEFKFNEFAWSQELDFYKVFFRQLKVIVDSTQRVQEFHSFTNNWLQRFIFRCCLVLKQKLVEKETEYLVEPILKDFYNEVWPLYLKSLNAFMETYRPLLQKIVYQLYTRLRIMSEPLDGKLLESLISEISANRQVAWHLAKKCIDLKLQIQIEQTKPEIRKRLAGNYLQISHKSENKIRIANLEESLKETKDKLGIQLVVEDDSEMKNTENLLEINLLS